MIVSSLCSLSVYSDTRTASEITEVLGVEPTRANEKGDPTPAGLTGRDLEERYLVHQRSQWTYDADQSMIDPRDRTGFGSLRVLVDIFKDRAAALASLRPDCETIIRWSDDSDSSQGGFVLPADLIADLAILGCDLFGTAYLADLVEVPE
jgi:hypothetical protein